MRPRTLRLREPLRASYGTVRERELLVVSIEDGDGLVAYGEAAPLEPYGGPPLERVTAALERHRAVVAAHAQPSAAMLDELRAADELPEALAAIDLALWDRAGRREGRPVAALLSEHATAEIELNATVSALDRASAAEQAAQAARAGFSCVKLKVGVGDDAGRVAAARAAMGPDVALRLDANGAWDVDGAVRAIESLAPAGLELVEEPVHGVREVREVRERVTVRVSIDETAAEPGALAGGAADAVCLKIARCGGIAALLAAATLVRSTGSEVYLASTLDGPLGIAGALHAAAALAAAGPLPACGLATLALFEEDVAGPLRVRDGRLAVPHAPGLGVDPF